MYVVYLIQNNVSKELYVGYTSNLTRRLEEHNSGKTKSKKRMGPWVLIYAEAYRSKKDAVVREDKLKQNGNAKRGLKQRIENSFLENKN